MLVLLQVRPYQEDEVVLVVSPQHRFASRTHIDKDELLGLSFVSLHRSSTVQGIKNILVGHGVDWKALKVVMVSQSSATATANVLLSSLQTVGRATVANGDAHSKLSFYRRGWHKVTCSHAALREYRFSCQFVCYIHDILVAHLT